MNRNRMTIIVLAAIAIVAIAMASCSNGDFHMKANRGDRINFSTKGHVGTRAEYVAPTNGADDLQINWENDDLLRISCAEVGTATTTAVYKAINAQSDGQANLTPNDNNTVLEWGDGNHTFYTVYPSTAEIDLENDATLSATVASSQAATLSATNGNWVAKPAMENLTMVSKKTGVSPTTQSITFDNFKTLSTAIKCEITNGRDADITVKKFSLISVASTPQNLAGDYTANLKDWPTGYPVCEYADNGSTSVDVVTNYDNTGSVTIGAGKTIEVTFFLLSTETSFSDLRFVITFSDDTYLGTVIKYANGSSIEFPAHKKSYIRGIVVPDGITWQVNSNSYSRRLGANIPLAAAPGEFTAGADGHKVFIAKSNLQFKASPRTWRFADNSWDRIADGKGSGKYGNVSGSNNESISSSYTGWIDLFCWGTSGWASGRTYYQPYNYSYDTDTSAKKNGSQYCNNTSISGTQSDWGLHNDIEYGTEKYVAGTWRTFTSAEMEFILNGRKTSGITDTCYAYAVVKGIQGLLLFADDFVWPDNNISKPGTINGVSPDYNEGTTSYDENKFAIIESAGAVFLPRAGWRNKQAVSDIVKDQDSGNGNYWSGTALGSSYKGDCLVFGKSNCRIESDFARNGFSVRLVGDIK